MKKVAAVVVTYNRKALLLENIESLLNQTVRNLLDIIVVDNASTDGTKEALEKYINNNEIIYKNTGANLGGAGGFQYGIRYAAEQGYEYVWIMDDDCIPTRNALEVFLDTDRKLNGNYGYLSSKVLWKDNSICTMNVQRRTMYCNVKDFNTSLVEVCMASFVSLFLPVKIVKEVGLPIKEFFIWTDDWEYTRRISLKYKCYLVNKSVVIHKSPSNIGANISNDTLERLDRYKYLYRNDVYLWRREGFSGFFYELLRLLLHIFRVFTLGKDNKLKRARYIFSGTLDGLSFNPKIEYVEDKNGI